MAEKVTIKLYYLEDNNKVELSKSYYKTFAAHTPNMLYVDVISDLYQQVNRCSLIIKTGEQGENGELPDDFETLGLFDMIYLSTLKDISINKKTATYMFSTEFLKTFMDDFSDTELSSDYELEYLPNMTKLLYIAIGVDNIIVEENYRLILAHKANQLGEYVSTNKLDNYNVPSYTEPEPYFMPYDWSWIDDMNNDTYMIYENITYTDYNFLNIKAKFINCIFLSVISNINFDGSNIIFENCIINFTDSINCINSSIIFNETQMKNKTYYYKAFEFTNSFIYINKCDNFDLILESHSSEIKSKLSHLFFTYIYKSKVLYYIDKYKNYTNDFSKYFCYNIISSYVTIDVSNILTKFSIDISSSNSSKINFFGNNNSFLEIKFEVVNSTIFLDSTFSFISRFTQSSSLLAKNSNISIEYGLYNDYVNKLINISESILNITKLRCENLILSNSSITKASNSFDLEITNSIRMFNSNINGTSFISKSDILSELINCTIKCDTIKFNNVIYYNTKNNAKLDKSLKISKFDSEYSTPTTSNITYYCLENNDVYVYYYLPQNTQNISIDVSEVKLFYITLDFDNLTFFDNDENYFMI